LAECDPSSPEAIRQLVQTAKPDIIFNPAAHTAVDKAKSDPALAQAINRVAPWIFGEEAAKDAAAKRLNEAETFA
jgi:dTDP-4-dehydrorhamnose reductase